MTELQREANRRHGYTAKRTLQILQSLYERHKIVSYPRTDSRYITSDMASTLKDRLRALSGTGFADAAARLAKGDLNPGKRLINDAGVSDHHALIPTEQRVDTDKLSGEEKALWTLIVMRFLAVLSPPEEREHIEVITEAAGERFLSRGSRVLRRGWREVEHGPLREEDENAEMPDQRLGDIEKGGAVKVQSTKIRQGKTSPPPRYNEATLLTAMENPGAGNTELKEALSGAGLGTPATRADIIEKILSNYYVERRGKELIPTPAGRALLELVPEQFRSAELTARWEQRLSRIAEGREGADGFRRDIRENTGELVAEVKESKKEYKPRNLSTTPCPLCSKMMMKVHDKKGRQVLVCPSRSCGYEEGRDEGRSGKGGRPTRREQAVARQGMKQYGVDSGDDAGGFTLADMMKSRENRNKRK